MCRSGFIRDRGHARSPISTPVANESAPTGEHRKSAAMGPDVRFLGGGLIGYARDFARRLPVNPRP
ncbi:hypothetical protein AvCA_40200 [Azotobacter vinelandii CA]|uniref:Uncharacterized protein n=2 Tax=Azotobacter vinelandii TaxID=354 RepID=C1DE48_AZOVD|nr:hypothetical protein Avin_40200 [Azotobacter vinelandii DJ]AGK16088.1 hypothetical protein AvCA_40200 [Azotobacter vinelandii CA]AGK21741.1 hypothetical protein AvCA6_40200 [Azotobacter vinelandii CA6]